MKENDLKKVIEGIVNSANMSDLELYQFELKDRNSVFELFFDNYFRNVEGFTCSHDKSAYVVRKVNDYLSNGKNYSLQETYGEYQKRGGDIGGITELDKVCYWCPKTLKSTEEATTLVFRYLCMDMNFIKKPLTDKLGGLVMKEDIKNILNQLENSIKEPIFIGEDNLTGEGYEEPNFFCLDPATNDCKTLFNYITKLETNWNELKKWLEDKLKEPFMHNLLYDGKRRAYKETLDKMQELEQKK